MARRAFVSNLVILRSRTKARLVSLTAAGIQIPDQVAVFGVDNDPVICDCVQVPLSSVRHDLQGMAYEAAALLDRLMNGERPRIKILRQLRPCFDKKIIRANCENRSNS